MNDLSEFDKNKALENPPSKLKAAMNFGAIMGLLFLVINFCTYVLELTNNKAISYGSMILMAAAISFGIKKYRDDQCNGFISYGGALGYGILITLFSAIIASFGSYIYLSFIDDSFIQLALEQAEIELIEQGQTEEVIEMGMSWAKTMISPIGIFLTGIVTTTFLGFIVSLVASAFLKNDPDSFENS